MNINPATATDTYKLDHRRQYPDGTTMVMSNFTARKSRRGVDKIVFFGLQYFIQEYLIEQWNGNFFSRPLEEVLEKYSRRINAFLGPNEIGTSHIEELHKLGFLPLCIMAVPEGTRVPIRVPSLVVFNTDPKFFWLTNYIETIMSSVLWGACTSATTAYEFKKILTAAALKTVGNTDFVPYQAHDFSFRGLMGVEAASISGAAHLLSFVGSDSIPAVDFLENYYLASCTREVIANSVAATEHSVSSLNIVLGADNKEEGDINYFRRMLNLYPTGIVSIVSDTFDYWQTITKTIITLKHEILARNGKIVLRPDTGNPFHIICGYNENEYDSIDGEFFSKDGQKLTAAEIKGSIKCLWDIFGGSTNEIGYKELDSHIGLIYGDSITLELAQRVVDRLAENGFASTNVVFGVGSFTYQYVTRDTESWAVKATYAEVNGQGINIYKEPKTDNGTKNSAKGITAVFKDENGELYLKDQATMKELMNCELKPVFYNGQSRTQELSEIRAKLNIS